MKGGNKLWFRVHGEWLMELWFRVHGEWLMVKGHIRFMVHGSGFMVKLIIWHTRRNIAK